MFVDGSAMIAAPFVINGICKCTGRTQLRTLKTRPIINFTVTQNQTASMPTMTEGSRPCVRGFRHRVASSNSKAPPDAPSPMTQTGRIGNLRNECSSQTQKSIQKTCRSDKTESSRKSGRMVKGRISIRSRAVRATGFGFELMLSLLPDGWRDSKTRSNKCLKCMT